MVTAALGGGFFIVYFEVLVPLASGFSDLLKDFLVALGGLFTVLFVFKFSRILRRRKESNQSR